MARLPIKRIVLYKHGVGYFERRGPYEGEALQLSFPREAMDDVLKSLIALDLGSGQVRNIDFETPEDRAALIARGSIHLSDGRSMLDLLRDLRGRQVRLVLADKRGEAIDGLVVGVDIEEEEPLRRAIVSLYQAEARAVRAVPLDAIARVELLEEAAHADLSYFLRAAQSEESRRAATIHLTPGAHDLLVGYVAPAPAWRVSYRLLYEEPAGGEPGCLLQGWGVFDNQLEEDLSDVELTLVAGQPISFRYRLYEPHTPERPLIQDEARTVSAPVEFAAMAPPAAPMALGAAMMAEMDAAPAPPRAKLARISAAAAGASAPVAASGEDRGALFAYRVSHPVSVGRGQSAMVPIVGARLPARRELLYNGAKLARHPVAALRLSNATGLTLERGPVTVLAEGEYAGEAVLPFTRADGELIVAYAVELGVTVVEQTRTARRLNSISLSAGDLLLHEYELMTHSYEVASTLDAPCVVTIEQGRRPGTELADTPPPAEEKADSARWALDLPARGRATLAVTERRLLARHEQVRSLSGERLQELLRDRLLDAQMVRALGGVLELYRKVEVARAAIGEREREREQVLKQQRQIQGNLGPLGREGDEGALRQRYVAALGQLEDQLAAIAAAIEALNAQIVDLEAQAERRLRRMSR